MLLANSQDLGLPVFNTVKSKAVILGRLATLLGNKNLVPWTTAFLAISYNFGGLLPVVVVGATAAVIDDLPELLVDSDYLGLTSKKSLSTVSLLALNALLLLLIPELTLRTLLLGPFALVSWVALKIAVARLWVRAFLVFILSVALLVLAREAMAWARIALVGSIRELELACLTRLGRRGGRR